jgi:hypothetical protein
MDPSGRGASPSAVHSNETIRADLRSTVLITCTRSSSLLRCCARSISFSHRTRAGVDHRGGHAGPMAGSSRRSRRNPSRHGHALAWIPYPGSEARELELIPARTERLRTLRKYAHGDLGPDGSFFFTGPKAGCTCGRRPAAVSADRRRCRRSKPGSTIAAAVTTPAGFER